MLLLIHGCGSQASVNRPPRAFAGFDQVAYVDAPVVLSAALSRDPDFDALVYHWAVIGAPAEAGGVMLAGAEEQITSFVPAHPGIYILGLRVNDGMLSSETDIVSVYALMEGRKPVNRPPVADAGPSVVFSGSPPEVQLDGSGSVDPESRDTIYYHWENMVFDYNDPDAVAIIAEPTARKTALRLPDGRFGAYTVALTVNDGLLQSLPDFISVNYIEGQGGNLPPKADAGKAVTTYVERDTMLDGSESGDQDGTITGYRWKIEVKPADSMLTDQAISGSMSPTPTFRPDKIGVYIFRLNVKDDAENLSASDFVAVGVSRGP